MKPNRTSLCLTAAVSTALAVSMASHTADAALTNLYTFNDGTANDSVGGQNGAAINGGVFTGGVVDFTANDGANGGAGGGYINLPNGLITTAVTGGTAGSFSYSIWFNVAENRNWAAVASFGSSNNGEDDTNGGANAASYLQLIPFAGTGANPLRLTSHLANEGAEGFVDTGSAALNTLINVVAVFDQSAGGPGNLSMYVDGTLIGTNPMANLDLATFTNDNNWLGRSQWNDGAFDGTYDEFAIYDEALDQTAVTGIFNAGPVPVPEPSTASLLLGAFALTMRRRK